MSATATENEHEYTEHTAHAAHTETPHEVLEHEKQSLLKQPMAVWATAIAATFAFMGIGLVDPILPAIAENLQAGPSEVSLLFTSYFLVIAFAMLLTGWVSSRIGGKKTLLIGLALIVAFATLSGLSGTVAQLVGFRAGWGLGNALFVATALAVIVGAASGGTTTAIILYEAALGLGISLGPILGALLGGWQWRAPFFGTAVLMALAFIACLTLLPKSDIPAKKTRLRDPLIALGHKGLRSAAFSAFFYNFGFFTILAFTPFILNAGPYAIGAIFFGWGLALAFTSVVVAPILQQKFGTTWVLVGTLVAIAIILTLLGLFATTNITAVIILVIISGGLLGINNTLYTELAMNVSDAPRPVASAGYNFVRWMGGAVAPFLAAKLGENFGAAVPFFAAALAVLISALVIGLGWKYLHTHEPEAL